MVDCNTTFTTVARWLPREVIPFTELRVGDVLVLGRGRLHVVQDIEYRDDDSVILTHSLNSQIFYSRRDWATCNTRILARAIPWLEAPVDD